MPKGCKMPGRVTTDRTLLLPIMNGWSFPATCLGSWDSQLWGADPGLTPKQKEQSSVEGAETKAGAVKAQHWPTVGQSLRCSARAECIV